MINKIRNTIMKNNLINEGDHIVVGVSGGPDSICLVCVLKEIYGNSIHLYAVHINHGIRRKACEDEKFVVNFCERLDIPCHVYHEDVSGYAAMNSMTTEEAGRALRYKAFAEVAQSLNEDPNRVKIAVAHTMNDNAETMLLNIFRGSGLAGVRGIMPIRNNIIRPLRYVRREEIEKYLKKQCIPFCTDETNSLDDYARNRIRHHIIPLAVKDINSAAVSNMSALSDLVTEAKEYMDSETDKAFSKCVEIKSGKAVVIKEEMDMLHPYIRKAVLYKTLGIMAGSLKDIESVHVSALDELMSNTVGKKVSLPYEIKAVRVYYGIELFREKDMLLNPVSPTMLNVPGRITVGGCIIETKVTDISEFDGIVREKYTKCFDYDKIKNMLFVRTILSDDYIIINNEGKKQKVRKYFINAKVPLEERKSRLLIADGDNIPWIVGMRDGCGCRVDDNTKKILIIKISDAKENN